jgi:hypothetical protein
MKIGQKSFFGRIFVCLGKSSTESSNFAKFRLLDNFNRETDPQSCKMTKKVKKWTKSHNFIFICFWVFDHGENEFQLGFDDFMIH